MGGHYHRHNTTVSSEVRAQLSLPKTRPVSLKVEFWGIFGPESQSCHNNTSSSCCWLLFYIFLPLFIQEKFTESLFYMGYFAAVEVIATVDVVVTEVILVVKAVVECN